MLRHIQGAVPNVSTSGLQSWTMSVQNISYLHPPGGAIVKSSLAGVHKDHKSPSPSLSFAPRVDSAVVSHALAVTGAILIRELLSSAALPCASFGCFEYMGDTLDGYHPSAVAPVQSISNP